MNPSCILTWRAEFAFGEVGVTTYCLEVRFPADEIQVPQAI